MVFPDETFRPDTMLQAIEAERCTVIYGVPTMFSAALEHRPDTRSVQNADELLREQRVAIVDQVAGSLRKAAFHVGEIPSDLVHPPAVG